jgi:hypothetical protein
MKRRFLVYGWPIKYEYGGRGLPDARGVVAGARRLECSPICDSEGGLGLENSPPQ